MTHAHRQHPEQDRGEDRVRPTGHSRDGRSAGEQGEDLAAVANAIGAIVNALTTTDDDESGGAPDQRGALDDPQLAV